MIELRDDPITLVEYVPCSIPKSRISEELGWSLWQTYGKQISVEFPSPKTDNQWVLTSQGYVGYIPLAHDLHLLLQPKVPLQNVFGMLEYAWSTDFQILPELFEADSIADFYGRLANLLAQRVLARARKGLYRAYVEQTETLSYVRGKLDVTPLVTAPWKAQLTCTYEEHTADLEDNQILAWTLFVIASSRLCSERYLPTIRHAYRALQGYVSIRPCHANVCLGRTYTRLNQDYVVLHALCRFFLEHSGPTHDTGTRTMVPFLIDMAVLFERFIAEWLKKHMESELSVRAHDVIKLVPGTSIHFDIDLTLYNVYPLTPLCVLDTKYKTHILPSTSDLAQIIAYAKAQRCHNAVLVYPEDAIRPIDTLVDDIRVRTLAFSIGADLNAAGQRFQQQLLDGV